MTREKLPHDSLISVPPEVAVCPICAGALTAQLDEWGQRADGTWGPGDTVHTTCETEPDLDDPDADDWFDGHYAMPYVDWLPVDETVARWIDKTYDFEMETTCQG